MGLCYRFPLAIEENLASWRRELHQHPELALQEVRTTRFIEEKIMEFGITEIVHPSPTGLIALIRGEGRGGLKSCIAFRADIDGLPGDELSGCDFASKIEGCVHSCGHDVHTAILLGLAQALHENRKNFSGIVKLFFQPAEEALNGSQRIIDAGGLKDPIPECVVALHCWPDLPVGTVGFKAGPMMASSDTFKILLHGKQGHGAHPDQCVDPVLVAAQVIIALQSIVSRELSPVEAGVVSVGMIHGGLAPNVIPDVVELKGTIRSFHPVVRQQMHEAVARIAAKTAEAYRGRAEVDIFKGCDSVLCDEKLTLEMKASAVKALGNDCVCELKEPSTGSEDYALYLREVPGVYFNVGIRDENDPRTFNSLHSSHFYAAERALITGLRVMFQIAMDQLGTR